MIAAKAKFNGESIEVPPELRGAQPTEVLIIFQEEPLMVPGKGPHSIWDVIGKYPGTRSAEDIDAQVKADREEWGDR